MSPSNPPKSNWVWVLVTVVVAVGLTVTLWSLVKSKEPESAKPLWVFNTETKGQKGHNWVSSPAIGKDGSIYILTVNSESKAESLRKVNKDGTKAWTKATPPAVEYHNRGFGLQAPSIGGVGADTIYYACEVNGGYVHARDQNGNLLTEGPTWSAFSDPTTPALGPTGLIYTGLKHIDAKGVDVLVKKWGVGKGATDVYKVCASGYENLLPARASAVAVGPEGAAYLGICCESGKMTSLVKSLGWVNWQYDIPATGDSAFTAPAIGADFTTYCGTVSGHIYAVNADGTKRWVYPTDDKTKMGAVRASPTVFAAGWQPSPAPVEQHGPVVVFGSDDGNLYAIEDKGQDQPILRWKCAGQKKWNLPASQAGPIRCTPCMNQLGHIYFGDDSGYIGAVYAATGKLMAFKYWTGGAVRSSPTLSPDGTLYVGSDDGNLYAFADCGVLPKGQPWPKFNRDIRNSGCYQK